MTQEELKGKYGDEVVMVIEADFVDSINGFAPLEELYFVDDGVYCGLDWMVTRYSQPKPRYLAEQDVSVRQVILYAVIEEQDSGLIFTMRRVGGDERLVGQISIGVGSHMNENESILDALSREVREEIGDLSEEPWPEGYIALHETEVDKVHVGLIYRIRTERNDLCCLESDKLEGFWATVDELREMRDQGQLESWSKLVFDHVIEGKRGDRPWRDSPTQTK